MEGVGPPAAEAAQLGDLAIGAAQGIPGRMARSAVGALVHLGSRVSLRRR